MVGPTAKVIKRREDYYMLPRSPVSPTLYRRTEVPATSGSLAARRKRDYILKKGILLIPLVLKKVIYRVVIVSELDKVEPFMINPQNARTRQSSRMFQFHSKNESQRDSIFWRGSIAMPSMDLTKAPVFSPSENHMSAFFQLRSLDLLPAKGLSEDEFWRLFSKCAICHNFMTTRTIPYHRCPISGQSL